MTFPVLATITTGSETSNTTTHGVALSSVAVGNLLLVLLQAGSAISWTVPSGWTEIVDASGLCVAGKIADGSEGASVDFISSSTVKSSHYFLRYTGAHDSTLPSLTRTNIGGASTNFDPPSHTPAGGAQDFQWIAVAARRSTAGINSYPSDFPDNHNNFTGSDSAVAFATENLNASSEDPAAYTLSTTSIGSAVTIAVFPAQPKAVTAGGGSYGQTGAAATVRATRKVDAAAGSYSQTGTAATLKSGRKVSAAAGSYVQAGTAATPKSARKATASAGSYAQSGTSATLKSGRKITAAGGSYVQAGQPATTSKGFRFSAAAGSYDQTGAAAILKKGSAVAASVGTYVQTGQIASLAYQPADSFGLILEAGAYVQTGTSVTPKSGRKVAAGTTTYVMAGQSAGVLKTRKIAAVAGNYDWSGTTLALKHGIFLTAEAGPYGLVGTDTVLKRVFSLQVDPTVYSQQGTDVDFLAVATPGQPDFGPHKPFASRFNDRAFNEGTQNGGNLRK